MLQKYGILMKKLLLTLSLLMLLLVSCGREVISLVPIYKGETVTTTDHTFEVGDFDVYVVYEDGGDEILSDGYTITQKGMKDGYYILDITVNEFTEEAYVKAELDIFEKSDIVIGH